MLRLMLGGAVAAAGLFSAASADDFHQIFEARCAACHGHAGDFARARLSVDEDGTVRGAETGRPVAGFMQNHAGGLTEAEIALFTGTFRLQIGSNAFFRERCSGCHGRAYDFARLRLILRDGRLEGRYSGRDTAAFLPGHARLTEAEAARVLDALTALSQGAR